MDINTTFREFITYKRASGRAKRTIDDYHRCLGHALDWLHEEDLHAIESLTRQAIRRYAADLWDSGWSDGTIGIYIRNLRTWLNWLHAEGYTDSNLATSIPQPKTVVSSRPSPTVDTLSRLVAACDGDPLATRDRALILLMASTGLRRGEIVILERSDVHLADGWINVKCPKTNTTRFAFLTPEARAALRTYIDSRDDDSPALFMSRVQSKALGYGGIYHAIRRRAAQAGIDPKTVNPHSFRVFLATEWIAGGGDEQRLMRIMGWSSPEMIDIYVRAGRRNDLQNAHIQHAPRITKD